MTLSWRSDGADDAPALVLLNSVGSTTEMWTPVVGALAEQFRVIRIDHRGHGDSPPSPPGTPCTLADLGADVLAVLDELGLERVHLAGLSLGGMTGMWLAIHHPDRISRLALLCTAAAMPSDTYADRARTVRAEGMDVRRRRHRRSVAHRRDQASVTRSWLPSSAHMVASIDAESYAQCCEAIAAMDLRADLGRIAAPDDRPCRQAGFCDAARPRRSSSRTALPAHDSKLLDRAAHLATFEQPGRICCVVARTTSAVARPSSVATQRVARCSVTSTSTARSHRLHSSPNRSKSSSRATRGATSGRVPSSRCASDR